MLEKTLSKNMITLFVYFQTWRLKLSHAKMVTAAFYLHYEEAKRELFAALLGCHSSENS